MKSFILSLFLASGVASANSPMYRFEMNCLWNAETPTVGGPSVTLVKSLQKVPGTRGRKIIYSIVVKPLNPRALSTTLKLKSLQSGDEDYTLYKVLNKPNYGIAQAAISDDFEWADLTNEDGEDLYHCSRQ